jgi:ribosomal protein S7
MKNKIKNKIKNDILHFSKKDNARKLLYKSFASICTHADMYVCTTT